MTSNAGWQESNPYRPDLPDSLRDFNEPLHEFLREVIETLREQHNYTQAGDTTFPFEMTQGVQSTPLFTLGSVSRFKHQVYGLLQATYVKFTAAVGVAGAPVGISGKETSFGWAATMSKAESINEFLLGLAAQSVVPGKDSYGWVITSGANLQPLRVRGVKPAQGSLLFWGATGESTTTANTRSLGKVLSIVGMTQSAPDLWILPPGSVFVDVQSQSAVSFAEVGEGAPMTQEQIAELAEIMLDLFACSGGCGGSGGGVGGGWKFAYSDESTADSIAYIEAPTIGEYYECGFFNDAYEPDSAGKWKCISNEVAIPVGDVNLVSGQLVMNGLGGKFALILSQDMSPAQIGARFDAVERALTRTLSQSMASAALTGEYRMTARGKFMTSSTVDLGRSVHDLSLLEIMEPVASVAATLVRVSGGGIGTTHDSRLKILGVNRVPNPSIGEHDWTGVKSQATGVIIDGDGQSNSSRSYKANRLFRAVALQGNVEKQIDYRFSGEANTILLEEIETPSGSPDSNSVELGGAYNKHILITANNTSGHYKITHEARIDDGTNITDPAHYLYQAWLSQLGIDIPSPGCWVKSGKYHWLDFGENRGHNGRLMIFAFKDGSFGIDTFRLDGAFVHNYGSIVWGPKIQRLLGEPSIYDNADGRLHYADTDESHFPCAAVWLGQVDDPTGWNPTLHRCGNTYGFQFGWRTAGLKSEKVEFNLSGSMASRILDPGTGTYSYTGPRPSDGFYPLDKTLLFVDMASGCRFTMGTCDGNVKFGADAEDCVVSVNADFIDKGYSVESDPAAYKNKVMVRGQTKFSHIGHKAFLGNQVAVSIESLMDYGNLPAGFDYVNWNSGQQLTATTTQLASVSSDVNWKFKRAGLLCLDLTTGKLMRAVAGNYDSQWAEIGGAATITPVVNAGLAALLARMTAAPAIGTRWWFIYDRILTDWSSIIAKSGRFQLLGAHDSQASNLDWISGANDTTVNGAVTFEAGIGITSGGTGYLSSNFNPAVYSPLSNRWVFAHVHATGDNTNGDVVGSADNSIRLRAHPTASGRAALNSTTILSFTTQFTTPKSLAANINGGTTVTIFDNGVVRSTHNPTQNGAASRIDLLRGFDSGIAGYRYSDETLKLFAYGKDGVNPDFALMAELSAELDYLISPR